MIKEIQNLQDLGDFISSLNPDQVQQSPKIIKMDGDDSNEIYQAELTEEPFLVDPEDEDKFGYPSELKKNYRDWELKKFKEVEPIGTVILYLR